MSKIQDHIDKQINPKSIRANTPDWQEGYEQGLLSGYTKSICLIRHLQRSLGTWNMSVLEPQRERAVSEILSQAMELISEEIK